MSTTSNYTQSHGESWDDFIDRMATEMIEYLTAQPDLDIRSGSASTHKTDFDGYFQDHPRREEIEAELDNRLETWQRERWEPDQGDEHDPRNDHADDPF